MLDAKLTGADQLRDDLQTLADRASDLTPVWQEFRREVWKPRQMAVFNEGALPSLADSTKERKRVHKDKPLVLTGELRAATLNEVTADNERAVFGIAKGSGRVRVLAILHKSSRRLKYRNAVPKLERGEGTQFKRLLRKHLMGAFDGA